VAAVSGTAQQAKASFAHIASWERESSNTGTSNRPWNPWKDGHSRKDGEGECFVEV